MAIEPVSNPYADFEGEVTAFLVAQGIPKNRIQLSIPPQREFGELATNAPFLVAKERRQSPRDIAAAVAAGFLPGSYRFIQKVEPAPTGFINFFLDHNAFIAWAIPGIEAADSAFGHVGEVQGRKLLIEHTSVNPNKEWHVGHLRNVVIGDTLVRIARQAGELVEVQNYIDDTGRQAAEAVLALREYAEPEVGNQKFDHWVGGQYVRLNAELTEGAEERKRELEALIVEVLHEMEQGRHRDLVERILKSQLETAARIGANYDLLVWESDIVRAHLLQEALDVLRKSPQVFVPEEGQYTGALVIQLKGTAKTTPGDSEAQLRVLVRSNGIPTYTGKDIPYMMWKFGLLEAKLGLCQFECAAGNIATSCPEGEPFHPGSPDAVINVVAEHQALQQQTVIEGLAAAGYRDEAARAHHLSYGMVSQTTGKISGRKGSGAAADDVMDEAAEVASARIAEKRPDIFGAERDAIAEAIAIGSIRYLMVQYSPVKPIVFDLLDIVSFEGNTGLYLQYALVRIGSILRRSAEAGILSKEIATANLALLTDESERALVLQLVKFPRALGDVLRTLSVNIAAEYAYDIATAFSQFYRDCPIMQAESDLRLARLRLLKVTQTVLTNAVDVLGIPVVDKL